MTKRVPLLSRIVVAASLSAILAVAAHGGRNRITVVATGVSAAGDTVSADGVKIRAVHFRRVRIRRSAGDSGPPFRDERIASASFLFPDRRIPFSSLRGLRVELREEAGVSRTVLVFDRRNADVLELPAAALEGAAHPLAPRVEITLASGEVAAFEIPPFSPGGDASAPRLLGLDFEPGQRAPANR